MRAITYAPGATHAHGYLAAFLVGLGEVDKVKAELENLRGLAPELVQRWLQGGVAIADEKARHRFTTFLRIAAGLEDPSAADALR